MWHPRIHLLLATLLALSLPATVLAFPLTKDESRCAAAFLKDSRKVVGAYGKATVRCVSDIGRERTAASDPALCVAQDAGGKLAKARQKQRSKVGKKCLDRPYPMDCGGPCEAADAGGATTAINDAAELADCLECLSPATSIAISAPVLIERGAHGRVLDGVTLATGSTDAALASCQAAVVKRYEKLFATELKQANGCAKKALRDAGLVSPPTGCLTVASSSTKAARARQKLSDEALKCGTGPFVAGACAGASGDPALTDCLSVVADCALCRWGSALLGANIDCDLFDDGLANVSCDYDGLVTTTTTLAPTTTTTLAPTTTTTVGGGTTTTTTTTTTLPPGSCGEFILTFGAPGGGQGLFRGPRGVAVGSGGAVFVADSRNDRVERFTASGTWVLEWGSIGQGNGEFDRPRGLATDASGNVYVADRTNHRIQKFGPGGAFIMALGSFGIGNGQFSLPRDVAVDGSGNIYVADSGNHRIQKFSAAGTFLTSWGAFGTGNGQFNLPRGLTVDASNNVYVSDRENHRIQKFTSTGGFLTSWGGFGSGDGALDGPRGVAVDGAGNVFVADSGNNRVQVFTSTGTFLTSWGSTGTGAGQFSSPRGVALDGVGSVYVSDLDNDRVQKFSCPSP